MSIQKESKFDDEYKIVDALPSCLMGGRGCFITEIVLLLCFQMAAVNTIMGGHTILTSTTIILDQRIQQGIKQGIQLENEAAQKRYVKNLMKTLKVSVERAMELLEIPQENRQNILKIID